MAKFARELGNEAPAINETEAPVVVKIPIPASVYQEYVDTAENQGLTVTELLAHRLQRCRSHSSIRSLYFSTSQLNQLEAVLQKRPIESPEQALALLSGLMAVKVGEFPPVPITASQAKRIQLGAYGGQTPYERLCYIVQGAISKATGT